MVSIYPVCALSASEFLIQGNDFYAKGDYKNALDSYNQSIAIDDKSYIAWNNCGNAFFHSMTLKMLIDLTAIQLN